MTLSQRAVEAAVSSYDNAPDAMEADVAMNLAIHVALAVDGLCLVPREASKEIIAAYIAADPRRRRFAATAKRDYRAMIAAANDGEDSPCQEKI